jgi:D-alanyl-D-alanine dipeptidase
MRLNPSDYVDLSLLSNVQIDLKYASPDNFMGEDLYGDFKKALLHKDAAVKFEKSSGLLRMEKPGWTFVVFDALRPRSVQWKMWAKVKGTAQQKYIADPEKGSPHNFGMALDISLRDEKGNHLDMGAGFDEFVDLSEPRLEDQFLKEGKLSPQQYENRLVLRRCMTGGGFLQLPHEWWHYNALPEEDIRRRYPIIERSF